MDNNQSTGKKVYRFWKKVDLHLKTYYQVFGIIIVFLPFLAGCQKTNYQKAQEVPKKYYKNSKQDKNGVLSSFQLKQELTIGGLPCRANTIVSFYPNGRLKKAFLARDYKVKSGSISIRLRASQEVSMTKSGLIKIKPSELPKSLYAQVKFYENGAIKSFRLQQKFAVQGIVCKANSLVVFYPSQAIKSAYIAKPMQVGNLYYPVGSHLRFGQKGQTLFPNSVYTKLDTNSSKESRFRTATAVKYGAFWAKAHSTLHLYPNGQLKQITLDKATNHKSLPFPANTKLMFDPKGRIILFLPPQPYKYKSLTFKAKRWIYLFHEMKIEKGMLASPHTIQSFPCKENTYISFAKDGKLKDAVLASNFTKNNVHYLQGSRFYLHPNGQIKQGRLAKEYKHRSHTCRSRKNINFHPNGSVKGCYLSKSDEPIQTIPCKYVSYRQTLFHPNGKLARCSLKSELTLQSLNIRKGSTIHFHPDGSIHSVNLDKVTTIQGIHCAKHRYVSFCKTGKLCTATLDKEQMIQGIPCRKGTIVAFHPNGKLKEASLSKPHSVQNIACKGKVQFHSNGKLAHARLDSRTTISHIPSQFAVWMKSSGKLHKTFLAKDMPAIKGKRGQIITLTKSGESKLEGSYRLPRFLENGVKGRVFFYKSGGVKVVFLESPKNVQGIPCGRRVDFHKNGNLESCALANKLTKKGLQLKASSYVSLHPNGKLKEVALAKEERIQGVYCRRNGFAGGTGPKVTFFSNGQLKHCWLVTNQYVQGKHLRGVGAETIEFYKNGKLAYATLLYDQTIQGIPCQGKASIRFSKNGKLLVAKLARDHRFKNGICRRNQWIRLRSNGTLKKSCR
jgi:antitoxin component YwqK of YwqJK toxin-antitoxin module